MVENLLVVLEDSCDNKMKEVLWDQEKFKWLKGKIVTSMMHTNW